MIGSGREFTLSLPPSLPPSLALFKFFLPPSDSASESPTPVGCLSGVSPSHWHESLSPFSFLFPGSPPLRYRASECKSARSGRRVQVGAIGPAGGFKSAQSDCQWRVQVGAIGPASLHRATVARDRRIPALERVPQHEPRAQQRLFIYRSGSLRYAADAELTPVSRWRLIAARLPDRIH